MLFRLLNKGLIVRPFARKVKGITKKQTTNSLKTDLTNYDSNRLITESKTDKEFENMSVADLERFLVESETQVKEKPFDPAIFDKLEKKTPKSYFQKTKMFTKGELSELNETNRLFIDRNKATKVAKTDPLSNIKLKQNDPKKFFLPESFKLFVLNKPVNLICDEVDKTTKKRPSIFDYVREVHKYKGELYACVSL